MFAPMKRKPGPLPEPTRGPLARTSSRSSANPHDLAARVAGNFSSTNGRPLDGATRAEFEPLLGSSLAHVRVHEGPQADSAARLLGADALAFGGNVVFGAGRHQPGTARGRTLLAHELAHVAVRSTGSDSVRVLGRPGGPEEARTHAAAKALLGGRPVAPAAAPSNTLHRFETPEHARFVGPGQDENVMVNDVPIPYSVFITLADYASLGSLWQMERDDLVRLVVAVQEEIAFGTGTVSPERWKEVTKGKFVDMAMDNNEHFSPPDGDITPMRGPPSARDHKSRYAHYHYEACYEASHGGDRDKALAFNAFGDHYLTDAFAAGHLFNKADVMDRFADALRAAPLFLETTGHEAWRDPQLSAHFSGFRFTLGMRRIDEIRFLALLRVAAIVEPRLLTNAAVRVIHNLANSQRIRVEVTNSQRAWQALGDGAWENESVRLSDRHTTLEMARKAVARSRQDVLDVLRDPGVWNPDFMLHRVWELVPTPTEAGKAHMERAIDMFTDPRQTLTVQEFARELVAQRVTFTNELEEKKIIAPMLW